jgi:hypothetical protein
MDETTITLGDREFALKPLAIKPNREWRKQHYETTVKPHFDKLNEMSEQIGPKFNLTKAMPLIQKTLSEAAPDVFESLLAYLKALRYEVDLDWLENSATEESAFQAWRECLRLSSPLGLTGLFDLRSGPARTETSTSLPLPNGDSAEKKQKRGGRKKSEKVTTPPTLSVTAGKRAS